MKFLQIKIYKLYPLLSSFNKCIHLYLYFILPRIPMLSNPILPTDLCWLFDSFGTTSLTRWILK